MHTLPHRFSIIGKLMHGLAPAIRLEAIGTPELIDFDSPLVSMPDYQLLMRLERERRVHLDLGLEREASGIGFAMMTIWQWATSGQPKVNIPLDLELRTA